MAALLQAFAPAGAASRATARARRTRALAAALLAHCPTPDFEGSRLTWRRRLNFQLARAERLASRARVRAFPAILTIDARNACNLRCPHCVTGARKPGRPAATFSPALLERLLDELGRYLLLVEFGNWGEPLLAPQLPDLIAAAARRGIGTIVATNLSVPLDDRRAEALVASGLAVLGAAVDGTRQESYEAYRRGGKLAVVHANLERLILAKRTLGSATPRLVWSFHVFPHNEHEIESARAEAARLGVDFARTKGFVVGADWDPKGRYPFTFEARPGHRVEPCHFLWERAVVNPDGSVAPCLGAISVEDDFGRLDGRSFRAVWNGARFQAARRLYRRRPPAEHNARLICASCPQTTLWHDYLDHRGAGGSEAAFRPALTAHMGWNYFFARIPPAPAAAVSAGR
jgi:MoaA/NifB/PqqE/SkfB family radical SAM enzyme